MIPGEHPVGFIDVSFYRDDFSRTGLKPEVKRTELPFEVDGATIVLVDDVLYTGRSVRAAINELFDYGRPARIELAVLIDRGGRELPIEATYVGARLAVARDLSIVLSRAAGRPPRAVARNRSERPARMRNPQLDADGELTHLLTLEGLPADVIVRILDTAVPFASIAERDVKKVPLLRGKLGVQPLLRELDAHAHDLRDRRQAAVGRRDQPQHRRVVDEQGRDAARHRRQPGRDERRHVRRPPCASRARRT